MDSLDRNRKGYAGPFSLKEKKKRYFNQSILSMVIQDQLSKRKREEVLGCDFFLNRIEPEQSNQDLDLISIWFSSIDFLPDRTTPNRQ